MGNVRALSALQATMLPDLTCINFILCMLLSRIHWPELFVHKNEEDFTWFFTKFIFIRVRRQFEDFFLTRFVNFSVPHYLKSEEKVSESAMHESGEIWFCVNVACRWPQLSRWNLNLQ